MGKIPSHVEEAAELAEKLHAEMFGPQTEEVIEAEPEIEVPATPDKQDEEVLEEAEDVVPHDDDVEELRKYKARYLSLKGKYDAEVPRLQHDLREFKENVLSKLTSLAENPPQTKQEVVQEDDLITRLKGEYGDEFIDSVKLIAEKIADDRIKTSMKSVEDKVTSVEDTQLKMAQEDFAAYIDSKVSGNWRNLISGSDPAFIEFLGKPDPSGLYTYGELVQTYNDQWEADKLSTILNIYLGSKTPTPPPAPPPPAVVPPRPEREAMVAPSRTPAHVAVDVTEKTIWTKDTIKEFERLDRQGKFTPEESQAKWNDLMLAPMEGRLR
jgi:hypothetical protein